MSIVYADTSALARAYFSDEPEHASLRTLLRDAESPVAASEVARVELAAAASAAHRAGRIADVRVVLARFEADCDDEGPINLIQLRPERVLPQAYRLVQDHNLRSLDAIHLVVALNMLRERRDELTFVTRDERQAVAARKLGLAVA